jgi:hypothetical protein
MTTPATPAEERRSAQAKEYGTWVATERIDIGGARAFNPGDPVPAGHVERGVVEKTSVARVNTKAAAAVTENGA